MTQIFCKCTPLWAVYPQWGWRTSDSERALGYLKRFGSVSVLNGHIYQVLPKVERNVAVHTAMSTALPQPAPGTAPSSGPMKVPAEKLATAETTEIRQLAYSTSLSAGSVVPYQR